MHSIALVGAGRIGAIHARNVARHKNLNLRCVIDASPEAATRLAAEYGAQAASLDEALGDDAVAGFVVASSTDTHLQIALAAAKVGKAVFCEKPIDLDYAKVCDNAAAFAALKSPFLLGFNRRFDPSFGRLRQAIADDEIGALETMHIISHDPAPPPLGYIESSGGILKDMTIHDFDMARWLTGEAFVEVFAYGECLVDKEIAARGDRDTAKILLKTASGRLVFISNSRRSHYGYDQRIEAFGSKGRLAVGNLHASTLERWSEHGRLGAPLMDFFLERYADAYANEIAHFADILDGACAPSVTYDDGLQAMRLSEAAAESMRAGAAAPVA